MEHREGMATSCRVQAILKALRKYHQKKIKPEAEDDLLPALKRNFRYADFSKPRSFFREATATSKPEARSTMEEGSGTGS